MLIKAHLKKSFKHSKHLFFIKDKTKTLLFQVGRNLCNWSSMPKRLMPKTNPSNFPTEAYPTPPDTPCKKRKKSVFLPNSQPERGFNGWENSLRQRPPRVVPYQSETAVTNHALPDLKGEKEKSVTKKRKGEDLTSEEDNSKKLKNSKINGMHTVSPKIVKSNINVKENSSAIEQKDIPSHEENLNVLDVGVGEVVWGKFGSSRWWPAIIIWGADCGQDPSPPGHTWVFWFGDHKVSELSRNKLLPFVPEFGSKCATLSGIAFSRAVMEAVQLLAGRAGLQFENDLKMLVEWAKSGFRTRCNKPHPFAPDPSLPIPESARKHLDRLKDLHTRELQARESKQTNKEQEKKKSNVEKSNCCLPKQKKNQESALKKVREGELKIEEICIGCDSLSKLIVTQHPLFHGGLCKTCKLEITKTLFAYGEDGKNLCCVICGQRGELLVCDNLDCNRCYCVICIELFIAPGAQKSVQDTDPWFCYLCSDDNAETSGLIKRNHDWQQKIRQFFQSENSLMQPPLSSEFEEKKPMRVLSLFDGIGTGRYVLDQLGIEVESYHASEIDVDAISVTTVNHKANVIYINDIEKFTDLELHQLCPINFLIGGSPCNDLSLVNPIRKGLTDATGTGKLFFDFYRILRSVQLYNNGKHLFWLYENVASMPLEYKAMITRFLGNEPATIDSKHFSPQHRARFFWGNIPGMYSVEDYWAQAECAKPLQTHYMEQNITLDSYLIKELNRSALIEKIRTVTTRSNSLKQGKDCMMPVSMNGEGDVLWVTELEEVFGFPRHYTDVGNIPLGRRMQLLGRAWSVPVIKYLFTPLKNFFKTTSVSKTPSIPSPSTSASKTCRF